MRYAYRLLHPRPALVVVAGHEKVNAMALAWHMPVEENKVAIAVDRENYTYELIERFKEFTLNVLSIDDAELIWKVGTTSGREMDKINEFRIELENGVKIKTPHMKNCLGYLECKVFEEVKLEEHSVFFAEIVYAKAKKLFKEVWLENARVAMHVGKRFFTTNSNYIKI